MPWKNQAHDLLLPMGEVVSRQAETGRVLAELALGQVDQRPAVGIEVAVVGVVGVVGAGDQLGDEHLDLQPLQLLEPLLELVGCANDQELLAQAEVPAKQVRVTRLQRAGVADAVGGGQRGLPACGQLLRGAGMPSCAAAT